MARVGIITGSGTYALPDFADPEAHDLETPFGATLVTEGRWADQTVLHVSRHGEGHARLSNHVNHRANVWALRELGADCVIACTACGALEPDQPLGGLIVFDELHFLANRLADGSLCTLFTAPGDPARAHRTIGPPHSEPLRGAPAARRGGALAARGRVPLRAVTPMGPAALVMAKAARAGEVKTRLEPLLGPEGCARLQGLLLARAARWAAEVAPGAAFVAFT